MKPITAIRVTGALVFVPLVFALGVFISLSDVSSSSGYGVNDLAAASFQVAYTGPLTAAFVAFIFPRQTQILIEARPARAGLSLFLAVWGWLLIGAPSAGVLAMVSATRVVPATPAELSVVTVTLLAGLACGALGVLVSRAFRTVLAVPLAALGTFAFLALPGSGLNVLLRNIDSDFGSCCAPDAQPANAMLVGSALVAGIIVVATMITFLPPTWARQRHFVALAFLGVSLVVAGGVGAAVAEAVGRPLELNPVQPRSDSVRCLSEGGIQAWVWPENQSRQRQVLTALQELNSGLRQAGVPTLATASEDSYDGHAVPVSASAASDAATIAYSMAVGYVEHTPVCPRVDETRYSDVGVAFTGLVAGLGEQELRMRSISNSAIQTAKRQQGLGGAAMRTWFSEVVCRSGTGR